LTPPCPEEYSGAMKDREILSPLKRGSRSPEEFEAAVRAVLYEDAGRGGPPKCETPPPDSVPLITPRPKDLGEDEDSD